jgi:uncharacterized protein YcfJ
MKRLVIAALAGVVAAPAAFAHGYGDDNRGRDRSPVEYASVVRVTPVYRPVEVGEPRQECWDERVAYPDRYSDRRYEGNQVAGAMIGATAGGVAGHQFGHGGGNGAATIIGALIGASIGSEVAREHTPPPYVHEAYEERCRTVHDTRIEDRVEGFDVTYRYHGQLYDTRMPYDPGDRIPVHVDVHPVSY